MQYSNVMISSSITIKGARTGQILNNVVLKTICTCTLGSPRTTTVLEKYIFKENDKIWSTELAYQTQNVN